MLIRNAIQTPDGTIIESFGVHDYVSHKDANGTTYSVDGGLQYLRRGGERDYKELSVCLESTPLEEARDIARWGSYGKNGDEKLKWLKISEMEREHILAVLDTQKHIGTAHKIIMMFELEYRDELGLP